MGGVARSQLGRGVEERLRTIGLVTPERARYPFGPSVLGAPTVSGKTLRGVLAAAAAGGLDPRALLAPLGVDAGDTYAADFRFPHARWIALWEEVERATGDAGIGLHAGSTLPLCWDAVDYLLAASATLRAALERFERYAPLVSTAARHALRTGDGEARIERVQLLGAARSRAATEFAFTTIFRRLRALTGRAWTPREVRFTHAPGAPLSRYEAAFGCPVRFEAGEDTIVLPLELLALPMERPAPETCALLEAQLDARSSRLVSERRTLVDRTCAVIEEELRTGAAPLEIVAKKLGVGSRTLQRRLAASGAPYRELVERTREETARRLLEDPALRLGEVGYRLGFADASAFCKAFRRWTGMTPGDYRRRGRRGDELALSGVA